MFHAADPSPSPMPPRYPSCKDCSVCNGPPFVLSSEGMCDCGNCYGSNGGGGGDGGDGGGNCPDPIEAFAGVGLAYNASEFSGSNATFPSLVDVAAYVYATAVNVSLSVPNATALVNVSAPIDRAAVALQRTSAVTHALACLWGIYEMQLRLPSPSPSMSLAPSPVVSNRAATSTPSSTTSPASAVSNRRLHDDVSPSSTCTETDPRKCGSSDGTGGGGGGEGYPQYFPFTGNLQQPQSVAQLALVSDYLNGTRNAALLAAGLAIQVLCKVYI
jgi:hypothetical protein